ncbi:MAG: tRNA pseudouridine(55) synthase TruB [Acutalibacteraceae bacterium]
MDGFICLDKGEGMTSFFAVRKMRSIIGEKKAGHGGTLDPMATGVLPVAFGGATRFLELFPTHDKGYEAEIKLGVTTDTLDITGKVQSEKESRVTKSELLSVLCKFKGSIKQIPPMYSAIQKDGKRLYELARQGIEIEREEREIEIYSLELLSFDEENQIFSVSVECSAGTYIRALSSDIGEALGCGAVMTKLRRTKALGFSLSDCVTLEELEERVKSGDIASVLHKVEDALDYEKLIVSDAQAKRFHNGGELETVRLKQNTTKNTYYRVFSQSGEFMGIGESDEENKNLLVKRVYVGKQQ